ncbi:MAG: hypothetical protein V3V30_05775 [Parvularculaceae bacterium]
MPTPLRQPRKFQALQKRRIEQIRRSRRKLLHLDLLEQERRKILERVAQKRKKRRLARHRMQDVRRTAKRRTRRYHLAKLRAAL